MIPQSFESALLVEEFLLYRKPKHFLKSPRCQSPTRPLGALAFTNPFKASGRQLLCGAQLREHQLLQCADPRRTSHLGHASPLQVLLGAIPFLERINQPVSIVLWSTTDRANCRCQPDATSLAIWLTFLWYASTASCNISRPTSLSAAAFCSHCVATPAPKPTPAGSPATRKSTSSLWACPILYRAATTPYPCPAAR